MPTGSSLTDRQQQILERIKHWIQTTGIPPTRAELAGDVGLSDASCVGPHLRRLAEGGWIQLFPGKNRGIRVLDELLPLVGPWAHVPAGTPLLSASNIVERVPAAIANLFVPRPDYLLTVPDDSMDRAGVRAGDVVAIHQTKLARSGDVVVARFGDQVTVKRFQRIGERQVELRPESYNRKHDIMKLDLAKHILEIDGIAVGALIRQIRDSQADANAPEEPEVPEFLR